MVHDNGNSMQRHPIFLSIVLVVRNQSSTLAQTIQQVQDTITTWVSDYEIIIVDNASTDTTISVLKELTKEAGLPNLQVYALTKEVDVDTASWVGLESALGDYVAVYDPFTEDLSILTKMLDLAVKGADVVFAKNEFPIKSSLSYGLASFAFHRLYSHWS